jgi:hypothetical protein
MELFVVLMIIIAIVAAVLWSRQKSKGATVTTSSAGVAPLRQNLRLKVMYDEEKIDRLVEFERQRNPRGTDADWYRAAIERWERDNR